MAPREVKINENIIGMALNFQLRQHPKNFYLYTVITVHEGRITAKKTRAIAWLTSERAVSNKNNSTK